MPRGPKHPTAAPPPGEGVGHRVTIGPPSTALTGALALGRFLRGSAGQWMCVRGRERTGISVLWVRGWPRNRASGEGLVGRPALVVGDRIGRNGLIAVTGRRTVDEDVDPAVLAADLLRS